ncbi:hypothetical protein QLQ77_gp08 [Gordonia phage Reyja]|uniref:Uncharacterized protein n=1 Tax=Gordonia phage Reyja TaxID=2571250 RepID=A0A4D6TAN9_9CAUD|nr:hypothetical protein QLQ77_gp08 [Gordonia phage Reyja]QCG77754.1 hypothetical protein SEA_REYJA_8 [Gordonia phage Reyja]
MAASKLRVYYLTINGRRASVQLSDDDARRRGLTVPGDDVDEVDTNAAIGDVTGVDPEAHEILVGVAAGVVDTELSTGDGDQPDAGDNEQEGDAVTDDQADQPKSDADADDKAEKSTTTRKGRGRPSNKARTPQNKAAE